VIVIEPGAFADDIFAYVGVIDNLQHSADDKRLLFPGEARMTSGFAQFANMSCSAQIECERWHIICGQHLGLTVILQPKK